jgi:adenylosuccinate synthase
VPSEQYLQIGPATFSLADFLTRWGDEGKGKLVDILARDSTLCCRAAGGNNAGHTIVADGITYDFHILPSGLISPSCLNLVGSGCVVHMPSFFKEMENLREKGLKNVEERVLISERAQICFDLHVTIDGLEEKGHGGKAIGTTKKGIGPCYTDKVARRGIAVWMLFSGEEDTENGGMGEWERRLRSLEKKYRQLYGDEALASYDLEEEVRRFKVSDLIIFVHWPRSQESSLRNTENGCGPTLSPPRRFSPITLPRTLPMTTRSS